MQKFIHKKLCFNIDVQMMPGDRGQHCIYDSPPTSTNTSLKTFSYQC